MWLKSFSSECRPFSEVLLGAPLRHKRYRSRIGVFINWRR
jgi:menaquinone-dependent protoporphyrinogen IX oxidase